MLSPSDFNNAVPQFTNGNYASNPINPQYVEEPTSTDYNHGVEPLQTLPAQWWNWFLNKFTARFNKVNVYVKNIFNELTQLLSLFGMTPDGTEGTPTTEQLKTAFCSCYPAFVKSCLTGTACGCVPTIGVAMGSTDGNIVATDANGNLKPTGITVGTAAGCDASCFAQASENYAHICDRFTSDGIFPLIFCTGENCVGQMLECIPQYDSCTHTLCAVNFCGHLCGSVTSATCQAGGVTSPAGFAYYNTHLAGVMLADNTSVVAIEGCCCSKSCPEWVSRPVFVDRSGCADCATTAACACRTLLVSNMFMVCKCTSSPYNNVIFFVNRCNFAGIPVMNRSQLSCTCGSWVHDCANGLRINCSCSINLGNCSSAITAWCMGGIKLS